MLCNKIRVVAQTRLFIFETIILKSFNALNLITSIYVNIVGYVYFLEE